MGQRALPSWPPILTLLLLLPAELAAAHERWIKHEPRAPINAEVFRSFSWTSLNLLTRPIIIILLLAYIWRNRLLIAKFLKRKGNPYLCKLVDYVFASENTDILPVGAQKIIWNFSLRLPALGLIYAAANSCLLIPSFPLAGTPNEIFRFVQTILAIMILTEFALPLVGICLVSMMTFCILYFGITLGIDGLPLLGLAYIYLLGPKAEETSGDPLFTPTQINCLQFILGLSFFLLGVMKFVNYELTIGVADNYPNVMDDTLIRFFSMGSDAHSPREWWTFGFACSEMMTGFLLATGIFSRSLALVSAFIFTKLIALDFGWDELPHILFIAQLVIIAISPRRDIDPELSLPTSNDLPQERRSHFRLIQLSEADVWDEINS